MSTKENDVYDYCLVSLWCHQVSINPLYHYVRSSLNKIMSDEIQKTLYKLNPEIQIQEDEKAVMRYQVKYPLAPALLVLAAVLEKNYKVRIVSLDLEREKRNVANWLDLTIKEISEQTKYGILISFVSTELDQLLLFSKKMKLVAPDLKIIVGGVHATFNDKEIASNDNIDYVIRGEGEITSEVLCRIIKYGRKNDLKHIDGITYKDGMHIIRNKDREFMNLEDTPIPAYHCISDFIDKVVITTMFSRGCPYHCEYCAESAFWTSNVRHKNVKQFVDELELLVHVYNIHYIHIADSTFGIDRKKLSELCDELEIRKLPCFFSINIRPNVFEYMGRELLIRLKELNFVEMLMGVESADEKVIEGFSRLQSYNTLENTLYELKKIGIPFVKLYLMLGSPNDTRKSFEKTIEMIENLLEKGLIFYATGKYFVPSIGSSVYSKITNPRLENCDSIQLDRYNSPPLYVPQDTIAEEMDLHLQMIQVVQYKYYLKKSSIEIQNKMYDEWLLYVKNRYERGYYF